MCQLKRIFEKLTGEVRLPRSDITEALVTDMSSQPCDFLVLYF